METLTKSGRPLAEIYIPKAHFLADPSFPAEADPEVSKIWGAMVQNAGTTGKILFGIGNRSESPGDIEVYCGNTGSTKIISPGYTIGYYGPVEAGNVLGDMGGLAGTLKFKSQGIYYLVVYASHEEAGGWTVDEAVNKTVNVGAVITEDPKATLEDYTFPIEAVIDTFKSWSIKIHNVGGIGSIGAGIVNNTGNPGNITIEHNSKQIEIPPNQYYRLWLDDKPNCTRLSLSGKVKFASAGTYDIRIRAMHREGETWYYDEEETITVTVSAEPPEPPTLWDTILEWWNGLEGYQKAILIGTPIAVGAVIITRPRYPPYYPPPY